MSQKLREYLRNESGATAIEYGFLLGFIGLTIGTAVFMFGDSLSGMMDGFSAYLDHSVSS